MSLPVVPIVRPAALAGQPNGWLPSRVLVRTEGPPGAPVVTLVVPAARAWAALVDAAAKAGHTLKATSTVDSYRPYDVQERIFRQRYTTTYTPGVPSRPWNGQRWYHVRGATAAVPGTSNHGWGLAVDTGEEIDGDLGTESLDAATLAWLVAHARTFGWSHELQSEPWHLHYFAGDAIPAAVLSFERGTPAPPTFEEDDMAKFQQLVFIKGQTKAIYNVRFERDADTGNWIARDALHVNSPTPDVSILAYIGIEGAKPGEAGHIDTPMPVTDWDSVVAFFNGPFKTV